MHNEVSDVGLGNKRSNLEALPRAVVGIYFQGRDIADSQPP